MVGVTSCCESNESRWTSSDVHVSRPRLVFMCLTTVVACSSNFVWCLTLETVTSLPLVRERARWAQVTMTCWCPRHVFVGFMFNLELSAAWLSVIVRGFEIYQFLALQQDFQPQHVLHSCPPWFTIYLYYLPWSLITVSVYLYFWMSVLELRIALHVYMWGLDVSTSMQLVTNRPNIHVMSSLWRMQRRTATMRR